MKKFLIFLTSIFMAFSVVFAAQCSNTNKNDKPNGSQQEVTTPADSNTGDNKNQDGKDDGTSGKDNINKPSAGDDKKDNDTDSKGDVDLGGRDENETPRVPLG